MAITLVDEIRNARKGGVDAQWRRTYTRAWRVVSDTPDFGAFGARLAVPVQFGDRYQILASGGGDPVETDNFAFALGITAENSEAEDGCSWVVTVQYGPYDPTEFPENPLNHPIKVSWGGNKFEKAVEETAPDENGETTPILNSAGCYFDPPITIDDTRPTCHVVRNEQTYNPVYALNYKDVVNSDDWNGFPPGTVKLALPTAELEFSAVCGYYFIVNYEFEINPEGWDLQILDQGTMELVDVPADDEGPDEQGVANIKDKNGDNVSQPVLLDGNGNQLPSGDDPVYLTFKGYGQIAFASLNLTFAGAPGQS
jgi:hypothetical protein